MKKIYSCLNIIFLATILGVSGQVKAQTLVALGSGTVVTANTTPSPINEWYRSSHCQIVYTAAEINAACVSNGTINKLGFYIDGGVTNALPNYTIKMKHTTAIDVATYDGVGLTTVYNTASYSPVAGGFDMLTLTTPFVWNGLDNIMVDVCFDQVSAYSSTGTIRTYSTAVTNGFIYERSDSSPQCGVSCSSTTTDKPQVQFEFGSVSPIDLTITRFLKPLTTKGCFGVDTIITTLKSYGSSVTNFAVTPAVIKVNITGAVSNTYTLAINSGTLGSCASKDYTITTALNMFTAGVYNFKGYPVITGDAFHNNDTSTAVVTKSLTPMPSLGNDTLVCSLPLLLNSHTTANTYLWNNNTGASTLNINTPGKYWVRATNSNGCKGSDTIRVTAGTLPITTLGPDTAYCQGSSIVLYAGNAGSTYLWSTGSTASSITVNTPGTYSLTVTHPSSCKTSDAVNITVKSLPTVGLTFVNPEIFCPTDNGRPLTEGTPAGGTYIGSGVTGTTFNASNAGQGTYVILYNYTGPNGCSNIAKDTLKVYACVGVEELESNFGLNVYPNPNNGLFTLELSANQDIDAKVNILTVDERLVYNDVISGSGIITKLIDVAELANGIYYLRLETKDAIKTYKILKQ